MLVSESIVNSIWYQVLILNIKPGIVYVARLSFVIRVFVTSSTANN